MLNVPNLIQWVQPYKLTAFRQVIKVEIVKLHLEVVDYIHNTYIELARRIRVQKNSTED